jgi:hypothetical protein
VANLHCDSCHTPYGQIWGKTGAKVEILELTTFESGLLDALADEVNNKQIPWTDAYSEYQSGGWMTSTLLGRTSDARNVIVRDCAKPKATDALGRCPVLQQLLADLGLNYMMVRLARMDPGTNLWEHKDYLELGRKPDIRLHLPIKTNPKAYFGAPGRRSHLPAGKLYAIRPTSAHGACNYGSTARIHLIVDVYENRELRALCSRAKPWPWDPLPLLRQDILAERISRLPRSTVSELPDRAEHSVLSLFFEYELTEGQAYRKLEGAYLAMGNDARARYWRETRRIFLGESRSGGNAALSEALHDAAHAF